MNASLKVILGLTALGVFAFVAVMQLTAGPRDVVRQFVLLSSRGDYQVAHRLLHPSLQAQLPPGRFADRFRDATPYAKVVFADGPGPQLLGRATTANGCESLLAFQLQDGRIIAFSITPLCTD